MESFSREKPYLAPIKERYSLCRPESGKRTLHLVLDIKESGIEYNVGDCVAIKPSNDPAIVQRILKVLNANGDEQVEDKRSKTKGLFREQLLKNYDLSKVGKKLLQELCSRQVHPHKNEHLKALLAEGAHDSLKTFQTSHDICETLEALLDEPFTPQELCNLLMPLMPRFYSIASSKHAVEDEIHLTITLVQWNCKSKQRTGVCTHYLCNLAPLMKPEIPIYIHPHKGFTLPQDADAPIIMIGPGTGVAPFRAFLQERTSLHSPGKNWLFFGEWNRNHHYYYEEEWQRWESEGKVRVDLAFSRDQAHKIYVQHRMLENGQELFRWIQDGAYIYVCGDASRMAKDVEAALLQIIQQYGNLPEERAQEYLKQLKKEKRYLKDIY